MWAVQSRVDCTLEPRYGTCVFSLLAGDNTKVLVGIQIFDTAAVFAVTDVLIQDMLIH